MAAADEAVAAADQAQWMWEMAAEPHESVWMSDAESAFEVVRVHEARLRAEAAAAAAVAAREEAHAARRLLHDFQSETISSWQALSCWACEGWEWDGACRADREECDKCYEC